MPAGLRFITENPFTDRYRKGREFGQAERMRDQNLKSGQQEYDIREERRPYDTRRLGAETDTAESTARVTTATEADKISQSGAVARQAGTSADRSAFDFGEEQATAPDKRRQIGAQADTAVTAAEQAKNNLTESTATAPARRRQAEASATSAETGARRGQVELSDYEKNHTFMATLDFLAKGDIPGAKAYAERNGVPIPDEVLNNANMVQALKNLSAMAKERYPNRPHDQAEWMKVQLKGMTDQLGRVQYNPGAMISGGEGAPTPPEQAYGLGRPSSASKAEAFAGQMSVDDNRLLVRLEAANRVLDPSNPLATTPQLDEAAVARNLVSMGRPDLARIYDPSVQPPQQPRPQPAAPQPGAPMSQQQPQIVPAGPPGPRLPTAPMPQTPPAASAPQQPQAQQHLPPVPPTIARIPGLKFSPSRQQFRDPATNAIYDVRGNRVQ